MVRMNIWQKALGNINNATHKGANSERKKTGARRRQEIGGFRRKARRGRWEEGGRRLRLQGRAQDELG